MEKRGYVKAGPWTPEASVENPEAVRQLHREFLRAGADVMQAFTFYASEDKLINRGNQAGKKIGVEAINREACKIAKEVAAEGDALVLGGICQCPTYLSGMSKEEVQGEFRKQIKVFVDPNTLIESDEHQNYPEFVKRYFPRSEFIQHKSERAHIAGLGELKKVSFDPLFTINHTCAMLRDNLNRLVRRTWCTTKKVQALQDQLDMFIYYHNHYYLKRLTPI